MFNSLLEDFIQDPYSPQNNILLADFYRKEGQYAAAISHYMRTAEYCSLSQKSLAYNALILAADLFLKLGARVHSVKSLVLQASSLIPDHPIAYNYLSKTYEMEKNWMECYKACRSGLEHLNKYNDKSDLFGLHLPIVSHKNLEEELRFNLATSAYYIGKVDESKIEFAFLDYKKLDCSTWIQKAVKSSLEYIKYPVNYDFLLNKINQFKYFIKYSLESYPKEKLISYSQCMQDIFILSIIKSKGNYIEIGSGDPIHNSNTYLLENLGWDGISFDIDEGSTKKFKTVRKNSVYKLDAANDKEIFHNLVAGFSNVDYLQFDCEPPEVTLQALYNFPFDFVNSKLITFEHDGYRSPEVREKSREYLLSKGYELIISDVSFNNKDTFEDWWCYKPLMSSDEYSQCRHYKNIKNHTKSVLEIFLN